MILLSPDRLRLLEGCSDGFFASSRWNENTRKFVTFAASTISKCNPRWYHVLFCKGKRRERFLLYQDKHACFATTCICFLLVCLTSGCQNAQICHALISDEHHRLSLTHTSLNICLILSYHCQLHTELNTLRLFSSSTSVYLTGFCPPILCQFWELHLIISGS